MFILRKKNTLHSRAFKSMAPHSVLHSGSLKKRKKKDDVNGRRLRDKIQG